ncbi:MAG: SDR family oxidoreductase [Planctomycetales bacterium]|nr:SDR family oxidoreductase [Planctomycetales bacterium]MCA9167061.1 SDR family oxidoreductase [Planctomycetales bacterium]
MSQLDRRVLVTGGGTGIGQGVAWALAAAGCRVVVAGRREDKLNETIQGAPPNCKLFGRTVDVADRSSVLDLVNWTTEQLTGIDVLVHAAGINIKNRSMLDMTPEQWDQIVAVNTTGAYNCMWAVLPQMRARHEGLIVNITSIAGKRASDLGGIAYCASKFGATGLGTAAGLEEAQRGIRITNIYPGEVDTPLLEQRPHPVSDERRAAMLKPADVAHMVLAVVQLPPHAHVPEMVVKPTIQAYS